MLLYLLYLLFCVNLISFIDANWITFSLINEKTDLTSQTWHSLIRSLIPVMWICCLSIKKVRKVHPFTSQVNKNDRLDSSAHLELAHKTTYFLVYTNACLLKSRYNLFSITNESVQWWSLSHWRKRFIESASHKSRLLRLIKKGINMTFFPVGICIFQHAENAITVKLGLKIIISVLQSIDILYKNPLIVQSSFA